MLRKILVGVLLALVVVTGCAYLLPRQVHVERTVVIDRPAAAVFPYLNSVHHFNEWSPWAAIDPNVQMTFSGPESGIGARQAWSGNDKVGHCSEWITESAPDTRVAVDLDFGAGGLAKMAFTLVADGPATRVTRSVDMDVGNNPVGRYMGLLVDRAIGADYERGLATLTAMVEKAPAATAEHQPASAPATAPNAPTS